MPAFEPPKRRLPDAASPTGATLYAVAGIAVWESLVFVTHHVHVVVTLV